MGSIPCASFREATTRKQKNRQAVESMIEMIIDAHMHYFKIDGFDELARLADERMYKVKAEYYKTSGKDRRR